MFVVGLVVGPVLGLALAHFVLRSRQINGALQVGLIALVLVAVTVVSVIKVELKLGLIVGMLLGLLLVQTPPGASSTEDAT